MNDHKSYCILWIVKFNSKIDKDRSINTQSKDQTFKRWAKKGKKTFWFSRVPKTLQNKMKHYQGQFPFFCDFKNKLTIEA